MKSQLCLYDQTNRKEREYETFPRWSVKVSNAEMFYQKGGTFLFYKTSFTLSSQNLYEICTGKLHDRSTILRLYAKCKRKFLHYGNYKEIATKKAQMDDGSKQHPL